MRAIRPVVFSFLLAIAAFPCVAQQLLSNTSFDVDLSSWASNGIGTPSRITSNTHSGAGALQLANPGSGVAGEKQCVAVTSGSLYNAVAWSFVASGQPGQNELQVYWCSDAACTSCSFSATPTLSATTNAWEKLMITGATANGNFASVTLFAVASGASAYTGLFDDAAFGIGVTPAVLQRFSAD